MRKTNWDTMGTGDLSMGVQEVKKSNRKCVAEEEEVAWCQCSPCTLLNASVLGIRG